MSSEKERLELALAREAELLQIHACCAADSLRDTLTVQVGEGNRRHRMTTIRRKTTPYRRQRHSSATGR